jgi:DNA polymerase-3 subunit epsilon
VIDGAIASLLTGPVLPPQLDPALIDRLPQTPGAYVFHDESHRPLVVGAAANLKLHVLNYFRLDHASAKALEHAHRVSHITWRATRGMIGARLHAAERDALLFANEKRRRNAPAFTWRLSPDAVPCIAVAALDEPSHQGGDAFGLFATELKARNALARLAREHRLCLALLGLAEALPANCGACAIDEATPCGSAIGRKRELVRVFDALRPLRVPAWPHRGPVGIRERSDLHVVDQWQFLGTARSDNELHGLLESRPRGFDLRVYRLLDRTLSRLPRHKIVDLARCARPVDDAAAIPGDATTLCGRRC